MFITATAIVTAIATLNSKFEIRGRRFRAGRGRTGQGGVCYVDVDVDVDVGIGVRCRRQGGRAVGSGMSGMSMIR